MVRESECCGLSNGCLMSDVVHQSDAVSSPVIVCAHRERQTRTEGERKRAESVLARRCPLSPVVVVLVW